MAQLFGNIGDPHVPTYKAAASFLEKEKGSGVALIGWTVARTIMIAPPMMLVGIPAKQAFAGAAISSVLISIFAALRIFDARHSGISGINPKCLTGERRGFVSKRK